MSLSAGKRDQSGFDWPQLYVFLVVGEGDASFFRPILVRIFGTECKKVSLLFRTVSCRRRRMGAAVRAGAAEETCETQIRGTTTAEGRTTG